MATLLLDDKDWTSKNINELISHNKKNTIQLKHKIPIHMMYWTAWIDSNRAMQFRDDVYKRDLISKNANKLKSLVL